MNDVQKRAVVITGASSGIGRAAVTRMVQSGWRVFGTARKAQDGEHLRSEFGANIVPLIMDVTDGASIVSAAETVTSELYGTGLDGLVNVAGTAGYFPCEETSWV